MKRKMAVSRSFLVYLFSAVLNLLVSYGLMLFLLRVLPKAQYGQYGFYVSVFSMVLIFFNFGHKEVVFKTASKAFHRSEKNPLQSIFKSFFGWNILLLLAAQVLLLVDLTLYLVTLMFLFNSWLMTAAAYHRGKTHYSLDAFALPGQRGLWLLGCVLWFWMTAGLDLKALFISSLAASSVVIVWLYTPLLLSERRNDNHKLLKAKTKNQQLKLLLSYLVIEMASVFYLKSDVLLLHLFGFDMTRIANYFFAIQLFEIAVLIIIPIGYFYFNRLADPSLSAVKKPLGLISRYLMVMAGLIVLMHGLVFYLAPLLFPLLIPQYVNSIETVSLVMFSLYPVAVNILLSSQLIAVNKERVYAKICFLALLFNIISNSLLIPWIEVHGVLLSKFLTELLIMLLLIKVARCPGGKNA
jgi:O-antigen/teichoic acid export membrane protein